MRIELIRPEGWVLEHDRRVGQKTPMAIAELGVRGEVTITALNPCPAIDAGEGQVVTGRYVTHHIDNLVRVAIEGG